MVDRPCPPWWARSGHEIRLLARRSRLAPWGTCPPWHLERYRGKYVAIDMRTGEVALVADTSQDLHEEIQAKGLQNVAMRAPREDEPLFVGPG